MEALRITATDAGRVAAWNRLVAELSKHQQPADAPAGAGEPAASPPRPADPGPVLNLLPVGVLVVDAQGQVVTANGAAGRMLRRGRDRLLAAPIHKLIDAEAFAALWEQSHQPAGRRGGHAEITLHHDDEHQATARVNRPPHGVGPTGPRR